MPFINLLIKLPKGQEFDIEVPIETTEQEILEEFLQQGFCPMKDKDGNPNVYDIVSPKLGVLNYNKTLKSYRLQNGDILHLVPRLNVG